MREPIISDLKYVTKGMIDDLEIWLKNVKTGKWKGPNECPFTLLSRRCIARCYIMFDNLNGCPCHVFGEKETMLAFTIICDVWKGYYK